MSSPTAQQTPSGPPYAFPIAQLGGQPTPVPDDIISAILLLFFVASAATNMTIFQMNRRQEHKFVFSALLFGFSMARIMALTMRIVWASNPTNISIAIAANILTAAGVVLLFIVNLIFAQRIVRSYHPTFGWHRTVTIVFRFLLFCVVAMLIMVIIATVHSVYTLDTTARDMERKIQLFAGTYLAVLAFLPIPIVIIAALYPRQTRVEKFGSGRWRTKVALILFTATLLSLGAGFRIGVNFSPRPVSNPAWYHHKACYYVFNYVIELTVVYTYVIARFDRRFHIPNGSAKPGDYSGVNKESEVFGSDGSESPTTEEHWDVESGNQQEVSQSEEGHQHKEKPREQ